MSDTIMILAFAAAVAAIVVTPGADMAIIVTAALNGRASGLAAVAGVLSGVTAHIGLAALGITAIVATTAGALEVLAWAGAAYLLWLGLSFWRAAEGAKLAPGGTASSPGAAWRRGAVTNLLNPKAYVFMLLVFPQFIRPDGWPAGVQAMLLGLLVLVIAAALYAPLALFVARAGQGLLERPGMARLMHRAAGSLLAVLGAGLGLAQLI